MELTPDAPLQPRNPGRAEGPYAGRNRKRVALKALAVRAGETLRDGDTLGRWGGEEFVIVLPEAALDDALRKARALCAHVVATPLINDLLLSISCGVACVTPDDTVESLFHRADMALYAAKQGGRNRAQSSAPR